MAEKTWTHAAIYRLNTLTESVKQMIEAQIDPDAPIITAQDVDTAWAKVSVQIMGALVGAVATGREQG